MPNENFNYTNLLKHFVSEIHFAAVFNVYLIEPIRLMFMDEARFGRISDTRRCWCPKPIRPVCYAMVSQEYSYAYAAVSVSDGNMDSLILPHVNGVPCNTFSFAYPPPLTGGG